MRPLRKQLFGLFAFFRDLGGNVFEAAARLDLDEGKLAVVERRSMERLRRRPNDRHALLMLTAVANRRKDFETSFELYRRMVECNHVEPEIEKWYVTNVVAYCLYKETMYEAVERWCGALLESVGDFDARIDLLKYRCVCLDKLGRYHEVLEVCDALRRCEFIDEHVISYERQARERTGGWDA